MLEIFHRPVAPVLLSMGLVLALTGCGGSSDSDGAVDTSTGTTGSGSSDSDSSSDGSSSSDGVDVLTTTASLGDCALDTDIATAVCAANAFLATLDANELALAQLEWSDAEARTIWSNFPVGNVPRNGLALQNMDDESKAAALTLAQAVLSDAGYEDMIAGFAADEHLNNLGRNGYGKELYSFAVFGYPAEGDNWALQIGGHHMAFNITYLSGDGYPVPHHLGAEPKVSFDVDSNSYSVLEDEGAAFVAMFEGLTTTQFEYAYLGGSYGDVLIGPDNGSGALPTDYPSGSDRGGVLVSSLTADQQALVVAAIASYVEDYSDEVASALMASYTSDIAFADTYIAWAGTESAGVDLDVNGTYMRIDGPRLWIEISLQGGVVIRGESHYHTVFRDKTMDYANSL